MKWNERGRIQRGVGHGQLHCRLFGDLGQSLAVRPFRRHCSSASRLLASDLHVPPVLEQIGWRISLLALYMRAPGNACEEGGVLGIAFSRRWLSDHTYGLAAS